MKNKLENEGGVVVIVGDGDGQTLEEVFQPAVLDSDRCVSLRGMNNVFLPLAS